MCVAIFAPMTTQYDISCQTTIIVNTTYLTYYIYFLKTFTIFLYFEEFYIFNDAYCHIFFASTVSYTESNECDNIGLLATDVILPETMAKFVLAGKA